ncbi:E3 ubiquitin-protein ligase TRIM63-like isoform X2 [Leucoraja erinacea]|uniref:E3 ubiquitin-protein ligase TRIM63-like isoform X2 n=1 Tax=Leucoraja erinaceus TaxID=7782 RepID=UPI002454EC24|nr:E3 ubiquitin-protein ligase TRIM63-like isoform X2 [Leucoraja erinacea]
MAVPREALAKELSCPVCLELFTPPILELPCGHNYCKQCIEATLFSQNCTHVNGHFYCPMCRKITYLSKVGMGPVENEANELITRDTEMADMLTYLRGRGIAILKRNIFAENVLEKFKQELEMICNKEHSQQMCEKHDEELVNLMCLQDDMPICSICKLFGDHQCHDVAKLADIYQERKMCFTDTMKSLNTRNESVSGTIQEIEKQINDTVTSCKDAKTMIDVVGATLMRHLRSKINALKVEVDGERVQKIEKLQEMLATLHRPSQLYLQMKRLLDTHLNTAHFLKEEKPLRAEAGRIAQEPPLQTPEEGCISVARYFKELVKGIDMKDFSFSGMNRIQLNSGEEIGTWVSACSTLSASPADELDQVIHQIMYNLGFKSSWTDEYEEYESFLATTSASHCINGPQEMDGMPMERTDL